MDELLISPVENQDAAKSLLQASKLPSEDLANENIQLFQFHRNGILIGLGGLEHAGSSVLLRSVAVATEFRNSGTGKSIVRILEEKAGEQGQKKVYLLTEIPDYFVKLGYRSFEKKNAPAEIQRTEEFKTLCPDSATLMMKELT